MSMDTKQRLLATHEMFLPPIVELLDMGEKILQKVKILNIAGKFMLCLSLN